LGFRGWDLVNKEIENMGIKRDLTIWKTNLGGGNYDKS